MIPPTPTWSPERDAIVVRDYPDNPVGVPTPELLDRLNAVPGPTVLRAELIARAKRLGVQRSQRFRNEANRRHFAAGREARRNAAPVFVPEVYVPRPKRPAASAAPPRSRNACPTRVPTPGCWRTGPAVGSRCCASGDPRPETRRQAAAADAVGLQDVRPAELVALA